MTAPKHIVAACALVTQADGQMLLVKTERRGWELPGGQVEAGETLTQAVQREVLEEAGVNIETGPLRVIHSNLSRNIVIFGFQAQYISGILKPQAGEIMDVQWARPETALTIITHPANLQRVRNMLDTQAGIRYRAYTLDPFQTIETIQQF